MDFTFITGATGGIGKAFSVACAMRSENLFLTGRSELKLADLKAELSELNPSINVITYPADLTDERSRNEMLAFADGKGIKFSRLINVAGVDIQKGFADYTPEKVQFQIRVNVEGTITLTHAVLKRKADDLEIITISSMSGVSPMPYFALYSATKACLTNFFKSLRAETKGQGVKVTTVLPGGVYTRPDVCEDIKNQGLWGKLSAKTPDFIAEKSLKAVKKNKKILIPGFWNKFLYFVMKISPENLTLKFIKNRWKKQTKDAF
ncbi:MAG: SDR family NAD(P)-dependent oxidoreductase [Clostridia bacterium]|nr:SDR family NAD(P)-dependent oxidoreductase [Clostridia bacterium]